jgi:threonine/homoserine efflux transporter RhtA
MVNASSGFADGWAGNTPDSMAAHFLFSDKRLLSLSRTGFRRDIIPAGCTLGCCLVAHRYGIGHSLCMRSARHEAAASCEFSLLLSLLPATATAMGIIVLRQFPSGPQVLGMLLVVAGVALHRPESAGARI